MLKLKLQCFGHLVQRTDSWEKTLKTGGEGTTEDEMVGWHHWLSGYEFEQALGVGDGQGNLDCCSPWGRRVRHDWMTELTDSHFERQFGSSLQNYTFCWPYDPTVALKEFKTSVHTETCSRMFIEALFITDKIWKWPWRLWWMAKQTVVHPDDGISCNARKKWAIKTQKDTEDT